MKVEIEFAGDFDSEKVLPISLGRLHFGPYGGRVMFTPEGRMKMFIDRRAVDDGYIVLTETKLPPLIGFGDE